jgi:hypothetical protein
MEYRAMQLDLAARVPFVPAGEVVRDTRRVLEEAAPPDADELAAIYQSSGDDLAAIAGM